MSIFYRSLFQDDSERKGDEKRADLVRGLQILQRADNQISCEIIEHFERADGSYIVVTSLIVGYSLMSRENVGGVVM